MSTTGGENLNQMVKPRIAVAIGDEALLAHITAALTPFYRLTKCRGSSRAMADWRVSLPPVAVISEHLSPSSGFALVNMLRCDPALADIAVLMLVASDDDRTREAVTQCGAQCHLLQTASPDSLSAAVSRLLNARTERQWQLLPTGQKQALTSTLNVFNSISDGLIQGQPISYGAVRDACNPLLEAVRNDDFVGILAGVKNHDNYSYAHSVRVATLLALFGSNLGLSKDEQAIVTTGGLLHDVGKMSIPNEVLNKAGRLTEAEFAIMQGHVNASVLYLGHCHDLPKGILTIAGQHHEKLDGSGYPHGLPGRKLDVLARMASIIDVFSALTDRRVYKPPMDPESALKLMIAEMAAHLDMRLLHLFRQMLLDATSDVAPVVADVH